jgi:hypothetical protein
LAGKRVAGPPNRLTVTPGSAPQRRLGFFTYRQIEALSRVLDTFNGFLEDFAGAAKAAPAKKP